MALSWFSVLRALFQRRRVVRELDDELDFHIQMETEANMSRGLTRDEARRQAIADFGGVLRTRDAVLDVRSLHLDSLWLDIRLAARTLAASRNFAVSATVTLGLGIGIATAMFTIIDSLMLRPVPYREPDQLASITIQFNASGPPPSFNASVLEAWRESPAFQSAEVGRTDEALLEYEGHVVVGDIAFVTPGIFDLLGGIRPLHGRLFDAGSADTNEALISETLWRRHFDSDASILGRTVTLDDEPLTVIGVLPDKVQFPLVGTAVWRLADFSAGRQNYYTAFVRFSDDIPRDDALRVAFEAAAAVDPAFAGRQPFVLPFATGLRDEYSTRAVAFMAGGVVLVFLTLCANVCGLMLARLTSRRADFGVRTVLGAGRGRLIRQALTETTLLGAAGVSIGIGVAWASLILAKNLIPPVLFSYTMNTLDLDARALAVTSLVGVVAILATGLLPACLASRIDVAGSLRGRDPRGTEVRGARVLGRSLLVTEIALACMLLAGATLLTRSFVNLASIDRGFDPTGVTTLGLSLVDSVDSSDSDAIDAMFGAIEQEIRAIPGVRQLAWSYGRPPRGGGGNDEWTSDLPGASPQRHKIGHYRVSPEFLPLYGISVLRGRNLNASDQTYDVVVSERFAETLWGNVDPVGRTFQTRMEYGTFEGDEILMQLAPPETYRVVGLAGELNFPSLSGNRLFDLPQIYSPYQPFTVPTLSLRCEPICQVATVRRQLSSAFGDSVRIQSAGFADSDYVAALVRPRAAAGLALVFAAIALLAAATGLFSVLSYVVSTRRRELGIRVALGASPTEIRRFIYRDGLVVTLTGLAIGVALAMALGRVLSAMQFGVTPGDPVSVLIVVTTILVAAWIAIRSPALAAGRVEPARLLRQE